MYILTGIINQLLTGGHHLVLTPNQGSKNHPGAQAGSTRCDRRQLRRRYRGAQCCLPTKLVFFRALGKGFDKKDMEDVKKVIHIYIYIYIYIY